MFTNVGGKIKGLAKVICWLGIIGSVIAGLVIIVQSTQAYRGGGALVISGIITMLLGALMSWLSSLGLYGFGQLVESVENMEYRLSSLEKSVNNNQKL